VRARRRAQRARSSGQSLAETAIIVVMLLLLFMGIAEVGYAFLRTNMIVHAARDGARFGATLDPAMRSETGCFTGEGVSAIQSQVETVLDSVGFEASSIDVAQECADDNTPTVTVTVAGTLELIFNIIGPTVEVDRSMTFRDEIRVCPPAC
jgi:Flp pilus assembly protein TadG